MERDIVESNDKVYPTEKVSSRFPLSIRPLKESSDRVNIKTIKKNVLKQRFNQQTYYDNRKYDNRQYNKTIEEVTKEVPDDFFAFITFPFILLFKMIEAVISMPFNKGRKHISIFKLKEYRKKMKIKKLYDEI